MTLWLYLERLASELNNAFCVSFSSIFITKVSTKCKSLHYSNLRALLPYSSTLNPIKNSTIKTCVLTSNYQ